MKFDCTGLNLFTHAHTLFFLVGNNYSKILDLTSLLFKLISKQAKLPTIQRENKVIL